MVLQFIKGKFTRIESEENKFTSVHYTKPSNVDRIKQDYKKTVMYETNNDLVKNTIKFLKDNQKDGLKRINDFEREVRESNKDDDDSSVNLMGTIELMKTVESNGNKLANISKSILEMNHLSNSLASSQTNKLINFQRNNTTKFYNEISKKITDLTNNVKDISEHTNRLASITTGGIDRSSHYNPLEALLTGKLGTKEGITDLLKYVINGNKKNPGIIRQLMSKISDEIKESPGKFFARQGIQLLLPSTLKNSINQFSESIGNIPLKMLNKLDEVSGDIKNEKIKAFIEKFTSITKPDQTLLGLGSYEKGKVAFDGVTRRAIVNVIPSLLSKILGEVSKDPDKKGLIYDYDTGRFTNEKNVKDEIQKKRDNFTTNDPELQEFKKELKFNNPFANSSKIDEAFKQMAMNGTLLNKNTDLGKISDDEKIAQMIKDLYLSKDENSKGRLQRKIHESSREYQRIWQENIINKESMHNVYDEANLNKQFFDNNDVVYSDEELDEKLEELKSKAADKLRGKGKKPLDIIANQLSSENSSTDPNSYSKKNPFYWLTMSINKLDETLNNSLTSDNINRVANIRPLSENSEDGSENKKSTVNYANIIEKTKESSKSELTSDEKNKNGISKILNGISNKISEIKDLIKYTIKDRNDSKLNIEEIMNDDSFKPNKNLNSPVISEIKKLLTIMSGEDEQRYALPLIFNNVYNTKTPLDTINVHLVGGYLDRINQPIKTANELSNGNSAKEQFEEHNRNSEDRKLNLKDKLREMSERRRQWGDELHRDRQDDFLRNTQPNSLLGNLGNLIGLGGGAGGGGGFLTGLAQEMIAEKFAARGTNRRLDQLGNPNTRMGRREQQRNSRRGKVGNVLDRVKNTASSVMNRAKGSTRGGGGLLDKIKAATGMGNKTGKGAAMAGGKILGKAGAKLGVRAIPILGQIYGVGSAIYSGVKGYKKGGTGKQRLGNTVGSVLSNLSMGILDEDWLSEKLGGTGSQPTGGNNRRSTRRGSYANGGVIDYTGTANVHGSKENPEMVLNSKQSNGLFNFIKHLSPFAKRRDDRGVAKDTPLLQIAKGVGSLAKFFSIVGAGGALFTGLVGLFTGKNYGGLVGKIIGKVKGFFGLLLTGIGKIVDTIKNIFSWGSGGSDSGGGSNSSSDDPDQKWDGSNSAEKVWNYLKSKGLTDEAAAGVLGNLMQESSPDIDPTLAEKNSAIGGLGGIGIMQWTAGRRRQLEKEAGYDIKKRDDIDFQINFMNKELFSKYYQTQFDRKYGGFDKFKNAKDIKEAANMWEGVMENAGKPVMEQRYKYAQQAYNKYAGTSSDKKKKDTNGSGGEGSKDPAENKKNTSSASGNAGKLIKEARRWIGKLLYDMGGPRNPEKGSADCSSLVSYVFKKVLNVHVGSTTIDMWNNNPAKYKKVKGTNGIQAGDIILFHSTWAARAGQPSHVGIVTSGKDCTMVHLTQHNDRKKNCNEMDWRLGFKNNILGYLRPNEVSGNSDGSGNAGGGVEDESFMDKITEFLGGSKAKLADMKNQLHTDFFQDIWGTRSNLNKAEGKGGFSGSGDPKFDTSKGFNTYSGSQTAFGALKAFQDASDKIAMNNLTKSSNNLINKTLHTSSQAVIDNGKNIEKTITESNTTLNDTNQEQLTVMKDMLNSIQSGNTGQTELMVRLINVIEKLEGKNTTIVTASNTNNNTLANAMVNSRNASKANSSTEYKNLLDGY